MESVPFIPNLPPANASEPPLVLCGNRGIARESGSPAQASQIQISCSLLFVGK